MLGIKNSQIRSSPSLTALRSGALQLQLYSVWNEQKIMATELNLCKFTVDIVVKVTLPSQHFSPFACATLHIYHITVSCGQGLH